MFASCTCVKSSWLLRQTSFLKSYTTLWSSQNLLWRFIRFRLHSHLLLQLPFLNLSLFFRVEASSHHYKFSETQNHSRFSSDCSGCLCCIFLPTAIFSPPIKKQNSNGLSITDDIDSCKSPKACFQFQPCGPRTLAFGQKAGESSVHLMEVKLLRNTSGVLLIKLFM